MGIKFAARLSSSNGERQSASYLSVLLIRTRHQSADYDKPSARLSSNSAISSREFDLGEPAR